MVMKRIDAIKKLNTYSMTDNKSDLISLLCDMLEDKEFLEQNQDIIKIAIEIGELYGYNEYLKPNQNKFIDSTKHSDAILREKIYTCKYNKEKLLNSGQLSLLEEINIHKKLFISAPTSFGKTSLIFEHIYLNYDKYDNICMIVPTNSLEEELFNKFLRFNKTVGKKYKILTTPHLSNAKSIFILTPEKYLLLNESKKIKFDLIVIDEAYKIEDSEQEQKLIKNDILNTRSSKYRMLFELVCKLEVKIIFLSPYTYKKSDSMKVFFKKYDISYVDRTYNYVKHEIMDVSCQTKAREIFNSKAIKFQADISGVKKALEIIPYLNDSTIIYIRYPSELKEILSLIQKDITSTINSNERFKNFYKHLEENYNFENSNWYVLEALKKGIALYISPIPRYIKKEILNLFNKGFLKILIVTTAFAEGVNSSAKNIIITNAITGSNKAMTNLDILNLSGRAGRFGKYSKGYVYTVKSNISERLKEAEESGVTISNSNYQFPKNNYLRSDYEIDIIDNEWLTNEELEIKNLTLKMMNKYNLSEDDLSISLCTSKNTKLKLYKYFVDNNIDIQKNDESYKIVKNLLSKNRSDVIISLEYVFNKIKESGIEIYYDIGDIKPYSRDGKFLWGIFYAIHSSGNIKEILKTRKKFVVKEYNKIKDKKRIENDQINKNLETVDKGWLNDFISDGKIDDFKLYNSAFKFIANIIEYRIPFYIGLYVSIFKLYCSKHHLNYSFDFDVIDISTSLENKQLDEKFDNMIEFGLPLDMIKKISKKDKLDKYEQTILNEYYKLYN